MLKRINSVFGLIGFIAIISYSCNKPLADFSYEGQNMAAPAVLSFENKSKEVESCQWDFGDGNTSDATAPKHEYKNSGTYTVKLSVTKKGKTSTTEKKIMITPPTESLVELETTYGTMTIKLYDSTPKHRDNFLKLSDEGYFDDLLFHRVINGFMIQGGDPNSRGARPGQQLGMGGPGYTIPAEFVDSLFHEKGALAAARQGDQVNPEKKSSGSQFYIVQGKPLSDEELQMIENRKGISYTEEQRASYKTNGGTPFLDRDYTVFGKVVKGLEIIDKIATVQTVPGDRPVEDVKMKMRVIK